MDGKKTSKTAGLLPGYFKKIGLTVMVLAFVPAIVVKAISIAMMPTQKELFRIFTLNAFIVGLLFVAWSSDKHEDEMTISLRLKAVVGAFIWAILLIVITPLIDLFFYGAIANISAQQLIVNMLLAYLLIYYLQKAGR